MRAEAQTFLHGAAPMPDRLSPGTFLSMLRHPKTGKQLDAEVYARLTERRRPTTRRTVCGTRPRSIPEMTQLVGYDIHGVVRVKIESRARRWLVGAADDPLHALALRPPLRIVR
jgi:hypothetical protein